MATASAYEPVQKVRPGDELLSPDVTERPWQSGILEQLPWTGLLALLLGLGCGVTALVIALISHGKSLDYWRVYSHSIQPTVLMAILITLANVLLGYAVASGITIFWWTSALSGRTLRELHASHSRSDSLLAVFTSRPVFNAVTVASLFTILLLMDQPLFQRGIRVANRSSEESRTISIPISSSPIQLGATGIIPITYSDDGVSLFHPLYAEVVRQYQNRDPINLALPACNLRGRCEFEIISTGWEIGCVEQETPAHFMEYGDYIDHISDPTSQWEAKPLNELTAFRVNVTYDSGYGSPAGSFHLDTNVMYKATVGAACTMRWRNCTLTEALIRYPVEVSNNTLRLRPMSPGTNRTVYRILRSPEDGGGIIGSSRTYESALA
jgi:hypothetical protein